MVVVRWLLVVELLGLACWPLCMRLFSALPDGGLGVSRLLGILILGFAAWFSAGTGLFPLDGASIAAFFLIFLLSSAAFAHSRRGELGSFIAERRGILIFEEALFLLLFAAAVLIQSYKPDITLAEKEPDMMYLQAVLRGGSMPPQDLWFSELQLDYNLDWLADDSADAPRQIVVTFFDPATVEPDADNPRTSNADGYAVALSPDGESLGRAGHRKIGWSR